MGKFRKLTEKVACYYENYDTNFVHNYIKTQCEAELETVLLRAEELLRQEFVFEDTWDMEPCSIPYRLDPMVWNETPNQDREWIFMLNRQEYLKKLLIAFDATKDIRYLDKLKYYLFDWIDRNPIQTEETTFLRSIDTGIRCMVWCELICRLLQEKQLEESEFLRLVNSIWEQIQYLKSGYHEKYSLSNWGVLQTSAIVMNYLWFGDYFADPMTEKWAIEEFSQQLELQVYDKGVHWEQSILYHMEVLNSCSKLYHMCHWFHYPLKPMVGKTLERMAEYVLYAAAPDYRQMAQGDSDCSDIRDVLVKSAVLFGRADFKYRGFQVPDLDSIWMLGKPGVQIYEELNAAEPSEKAYVDMESGNFYFRNSYKEDANFTYLQNGPLGSSHGHVDLTHISLYYRGIPFLVDSGRYTYREEEPLRQALKSAAAHNVAVLDQDPPGVPEGSWSYSKYAQCLPCYTMSKEGIHYAQLPYTQTLTNGERYLANRRVVILEEGIWLIADQMQCKGTHSCQKYYNLDQDVTTERADGKLCLCSSGRKLFVHTEHEFDQEIAIQSRRYNQKAETTRLVKHLPAFSDELLDWECFAGEDVQIQNAVIRQGSTKQALEQERVLAVEVWIRHHVEYVIILFHKETSSGNKIYFYKDIPLYGKCVVLKMIQGSIQRIRLQ